MSAPSPAGRTPSPRGKIALVLWIGFWGLAFTLTHTPVVPTGVFRFRFADKVTHALLYATLTTLGARHLQASGRSTSTQALLVWAVVYAAYGAMDEWLQSFVGRTMSFYDWLADLTGIILATAWSIRLRPADRRVH